MSSTDELLADLNLQRILNSSHEGTRQMLDQVMTIVERGGTISMAKWDRLKRVRRYLDTQKRNIVLGAASVAAAGATTGGVGAPIAAGGKMITWGAGMLWHRLNVSYRMGRYRSPIRSVRERNLPFKLAHVDAMIDDARYILKHQGLTDLFNAFANLQDDYDTIKRDMWVEISPWIENELSLRIATGANDIRLSRTPNNCNEAIRLLENICRIRYRYSQVADTGDMLEEFCTTVTLVISQFDAYGYQILRELWKMALGDDKPAENIEKCLAPAGRVLQRLNGIVNAKGLRKHLGRRLFGRVKNYQGWICGILFGDGDPYNTPDLPDDFVKAMKIQAAVSEPSGARKVAEKMRESLSEGFRASLQDYLGSSARIKYHGQEKFLSDLMRGNVEDLTLFITTKGLDIALGFLQECAKSGVIRSPGKVAAESAFGQFYTVDAIQAAVESVLGTAVDMANAAWNEWKLKTRQTYGIGGGSLGLFGKRQQTFSERIGTLRTLAKEEINDYLDMTEDWLEVYKQIASTDGSGNFIGVKEMGPEEAGEMLLRYQDAARRYYGNRVGSMLEEVVVHAARPFRLISEQLLPEALERIDTYIRGHYGLQGGRNCEPYCFCRKAMMYPILDEDRYSVRSRSG